MFRRDEVPHLHSLGHTDEEWGLVALRGAEEVGRRNVRASILASWKMAGASDSDTVHSLSKVGIQTSTQEVAALRQDTVPGSARWQPQDRA